MPDIRLVDQDHITVDGQVVDSTYPHFDLLKAQAQPAVSTGEPSFEESPWTPQDRNQVEKPVTGWNPSNGEPGGLPSTQNIQAAIPAPTAQDIGEASPQNPYGQPPVSPTAPPGQTQTATSSTTSQPTTPPSANPYLDKWMKDMTDTQAQLDSFTPQALAGNQEAVKRSIELARHQGELNIQKAQLDADITGTSFAEQKRYREQLEVNQKKQRDAETAAYEDIKSTVESIQNSKPGSWHDATPLKNRILIGLAGKQAVQESMNSFYQRERDAFEQKKSVLGLKQNLFETLHKMGVSNQAMDDTAHSVIADTILSEGKMKLAGMAPGQAQQDLQKQLADIQTQAAQFRVKALEAQKKAHIEITEKMYGAANIKDEALKNYFSHLLGKNPTPEQSKAVIGMKTSIDSIDTLKDSFEKHAVRFSGDNPITGYDLASHGLRSGEGGKDAYEAARRTTALVISKEYSATEEGKQSTLSFDTVLNSLPTFEDNRWDARKKFADLKEQLAHKLANNVNTWKAEGTNTDTFNASGQPSGIKRY